MYQEVRIINKCVIVCSCFNGFGVPGQHAASGDHRAGGILHASVNNNIGYSYK